MANTRSRRGKATTRRNRGTPAKPKVLSRPAKTQVAQIASRVLNGKAETKMVAFFNGPTASVGPTNPVANSIGTYGQAGRVAHNAFINNNDTDILKVIPDVLPGGGAPSDNTREGRYINPVSGQLRCRVSITPTTSQNQGWMNNIAYDLTVVAYLLQSVTYKTYRALYEDNDFTKMLDVMDGTTTSFDGTFQGGTLPVEKGYYKVLGKKMIYLRNAGVPVGQSGLVTVVGNQNSHKLQHEWTWNYGKHLPKKLIYPEDSQTPAEGLNEPLNSSIFWCLGYYNTDGSTSDNAINVSIDYTSIMKFKDF